MKQHLVIRSAGEGQRLDAVHCRNVRFQKATVVSPLGCNCRSSVVPSERLSAADARLWQGIKPVPLRSGRPRAVFGNLAIGDALEDSAQFGLRSQSLSRLDLLVFRCCRREDGLVAGGGPPRPATGGFRVRSKDRIRQLRLGFYEGIVAAGWIPLSSSPLFPAIAIKAFADARSPGFVTGPNQGLAIVHRSTNIAALHSKPLPIHNGPRTAPCETSPTRSPVS